MTDSNEKTGLTPTGGTTPTTQNKIKIGVKKPMWQRAKETPIKNPFDQVSGKEPATAALTVDNRLALLLDCSGSMAGSSGGWSYNQGNTSKSKIALLRDAVKSFIDQIDFLDTSVAIETFPGGEASRHAPSIDALSLKSHPLHTGGGTPMAEAMAHVIKTYPVTRGVLISDGQANDTQAALEEADNYAAAEIPVDCVHIGHEEAGEGLLKEIAEKTGGIYVKFTDVTAFAKALVYLAPSGRTRLLSGQVGANEIGAKEVILSLGDGGKVK